MGTTRRVFLKTAGLSAGAALIATKKAVSAGKLGNAAKGTAAVTKAPPRASGIISRDEKQSIPFTLGLASYTFRTFSLDDTIAMTLRLGLETIALKSVHLPLDTPLDAVKSAADKIRAAGLVLYGCGVIYMNNEAEIRQAFEYAKAAGIGFIIGVPAIELLPAAERAVKEYNICLALHNHGPTDKVYPTPESAFNRIRNLDYRIGLCLDVGHAARSGLDPAAEAEKYSDRLLDVHIKDVTSADVQGGPIEIGRGVIDIPKLLRSLLGYGGWVSLEYEKDEKDPLPGAAESVGYLRGVLDTL